MKKNYPKTIFYICEKVYKCDKCLKYKGIKPKYCKYFKRLQLLYKILFK